MNKRLWGRWLRCKGGLAAGLLTLGSGLAGQAAWAVTCTTQAQMTAAERSGLEAASLKLAGYAVAGDANALKAATLPAVASDFGGIAATVGGLAAPLKGARLNLDSLYALDAKDLKADEAEAQFFCSAPGSPLLVTLTIPGLPPGEYAVALLRAEEVAKPEELGMILAKAPSGGGANGWQLAGFFAHPLTFAGHDGLWFWTKARELNKSGAKWSSFFYYQTARPLVVPADFLSSPNLEKLDREIGNVRPDGLPGDGGTPPMVVAGGDHTYTVTSVRTDATLGGLDLLIHYNANAGDVDPVFQRTQAVALMKAMLDQHPDLKANFHGLWVYADSPGRQPYAVEMTMDQIASAAAH